MGILLSGNAARVVFLLSLATLAAFAQSSSAADLEGLITDAAGAAVPDARLMVNNVETGVRRESAANNLGRYRIPNLPAGQYELTVSKEGFATVERKGLLLQIGQVVTIDARLPLASQSEKITVEAAAPLVEPGRITIGAVVDKTEIDNLPIDGRNFLDFSTTVAGVTEQQTSGQGSGLSFNGQRGRSNNISIDGADNNGQLNGNTRLTMSQDAVREFQVVTNMFAPEFGRAAGGLVNVVSRSGTNDIHGSAFFYARNEALDGRNAFVTTADKPQFQRYTEGATLGGPIIHNKTFFFAALDYTKRNESGLVTIADASVATINSTLASRPFPRGGVTSIGNGAFPINRVDTLSSIKIDHSLRPNDALAFRYLFGQDRQSNAGGVGIGGLTDVSGGGGQRNRDQSYLWTWDHIFSPTLLSDLRFQYAPRSLTQYDNDPIGPRVTISGVATFGRDTNFPVLLNEGREQLQETVSKQTGRHFIKFGADINWVHAHTSFPVNFGGTFSFSNLTDFVAGRVNTFSQGFGDPEIRLPDTLMGLYVQDTFKLARNLDVVYGLRYDYDMQPQGIKRDPNNPIEAPLQTGIHRDGKDFAPRLGITWNPDGKGKTVIRTGYGLFYDKIFLLAARNALIGRQTLTLNQTQSQGQLALGAFPPGNAFPTGFNLPKGSLNTVAQDLKMPYAQQANFGVERAISGNWAVSATYIVVRGVHGLRALNINLGPPVVLTAANAAALGVTAPNAQQLGRRVYPTTDRFDQNFNNIYQVNSTSNSLYSGLAFSLQKRFSHHFQMRVNYTFSKVIDDATDFTQAQQPADPYNARAERARSTEDQPHRFTLTGVGNLPYGWILSTNWVFVSGLPQNITVGSDSNLDGNSNDRPFVGAYTLGRNTWNGPGRAVVNTRLSKQFHFRDRASLQVLGEAFNVQNRVNYTDIVTTWGTTLAARSTLGSYTSAANPRQVQLGLRVQF